MQAGSGERATGLGVRFGDPADAQAKGPQWDLSRAGSCSSRVIPVFAMLVRLLWKHYVQIIPSLTPPTTL